MNDARGVRRSANRRLAEEGPARGVLVTVSLAPPNAAGPVESNGNQLRLRDFHRLSPVYVDRDFGEGV